MLQTINPRFMTYDADLTIRKLAAKISKRNGLGGQTAAIRFALSFTDSAQKAEPAPLDYHVIASDLLRDLIIHGATWQIRRDALNELINRMHCAEAMA